MPKNPCAKTVKRANAYEVWRSFGGSWTWYVLKKWQVNDDQPYARWFCDVVTPHVPEGEMGDVYVAEIKANARRIDRPKPAPVSAPDAAPGAIGAVLNFKQTGRV